MAQDLKQELKYTIGLFCKNVFDQVKQEFPKIRSIIIHYSNEQIYIGNCDRGRFKSLYYTPESEIKDNIFYKLDQLIKTTGQCISDCKIEIDNMYPNRKLRSYNIFYNSTGKINICESKIGSVRIELSRLFNEFNII